MLDKLKKRKGKKKRKEKLIDKPLFQTTGRGAGSRPIF